MGQLTVERLPVHEVCAGMPGRLGARLGQGRAAGWQEPQPACGLPWELKRPPGERRGMGRAHGWRLHGGTGKGPGGPSWWEGLGQQTWLVATADFLSTLVAAVN